jgi:hypothetical protein
MYGIDIGKFLKLGRTWHGSGGKLKRRNAGFGRAAVVVLASALIFPAGALAQTSGALTVTANVQGSIQLIFDDNASVGQVGYCPLSNAGTNNAGLDLGTASGPTGDTLPCVNFVRNIAPATYQVSSAFDVVVRKANTASATYRLAVAISSVPPATVSWLMNTLTMSTAPQTLQAANPYGRTTETLYVRVRNTVPAQALTEVINFVATAN